MIVEKWLLSLNNTNLIYKYSNLTTMSATQKARANTVKMIMNQEFWDPEIEDIEENPKLVQIATNLSGVIDKMTNREIWNLLKKI